ncbi:MAG: Uma2 family endonuclease [Geminocystis sp. GBBB08]|nr:Uma2 family endonuclease [Geminocystis sp. GBBB08]MBL1210402.1 Uma2 family endonuclease [Geminocystis sp. GBBB08]
MTATIIEQKETLIGDKKNYTSDEYLVLDEKAEYKHEYRNGKIIPMAGGTINHNQIAGNIYANLKFALKGLKYRVFIGDVRLWIPRYNQYTYPDVIILSGEPIYHKGNTTITNPLLIMEVLSQSTQDYDRGTKFTYYRSISELQEYILIDQYNCKIEQFSKNNHRQWLLREYEALEETLSLESLNLQLNIADIYEQVTFEDHQ